MSQRKVDWTLTQDTFNRFLSALHTDRQTAGEHYEHIRAALVRFFESRRGRAPLNSEASADEVIDRVSRKLQDGEAIADVRSYCYGVARLLFLEKSKAHALDAGDAALAATPAPPVDTNEETRSECLDGCVGALAKVDRDLILEYHRDRGLTKIRTRKALAEALGLHAGGLRIRAHRIRLKLERCVSECVDRQSAMKHSVPGTHLNRRG